MKLERIFRGHHKTSSPRYVKQGDTGFAPLAGEWPRVPAYDRDDIYTNLVYLKKDIDRWYSSICWTSDEAHPEKELDALGKLWELVDLGTTNDIAEEVHQLLIDSLKLLEPFSRRIIYCREEHIKLQIAIALCSRKLVEGMLALHAFEERLEDLAKARQVVLEANKTLLSGNEQGLLDKKLKVVLIAESDLQAEEREVEKLLEAGRVERERRGEVLIPLGGRHLPMKELLKSIGYQLGEDGRVKEGDRNVHRAEIAARIGEIKLVEELLV